MAEIVFGKEQAMLADIAARFFADRVPIEKAREQLGADSGLDSALWSEMVDAGWLDLAIPEAYGGAGLGMAELVSIVEPMGRRLLGSPFVATQVVIQGLVRSGESGEALRREWLPKMAGGAVGTLAAIEPDGDWSLSRCHSRATLQGSRAVLDVDKRFVLDGPSADLVLVTVALDGAPALACVARELLPATAFEREIVIDETRRSYRLVLEGLEIDADRVLSGPDAAAALDGMRDAGILLTAAEACGGIAGALEVIVGYLKSRRQFDRLIGSYQALKHPTVDILIGLERSRSHLYHAATVFGSADAEAALRMAKAEASDAFAFAGDRAVQFHGGFGFTYECDAQLYLRRALWCQYQFGDAMHHRKHLADLLL